MIKVKMVTEGGGEMSDPPTCGPLNLTLHSLFKQVDVLVDGKISRLKWKSAILTKLIWISVYFMDKT